MHDLQRAQYRQELIDTELTRVRAAADSWRKGLGGLLAGLVGFSLIKGRSDVSAIAPWASVTVGALLLLAFVVGAAGALLLIRAAHGRPAVVSSGRLQPKAVTTHIEALGSARDLRWGVGATLTCATLLVAALGTTWYAPGRAELRLKVSHEGATDCGSVVRLREDVLVLKTSSGERSIPVADLDGLEPVDDCSGP